MQRATATFVVNQSLELTCGFAISAAPIKRTAVERQVNTQIVFLFGLLLALSLGSTIGASIQMARQIDPLVLRSLADQLCVVVPRTKSVVSLNLSRHLCTKYASFLLNMGRVFT